MHRFGRRNTTLDEEPQASSSVDDPGAENSPSRSFRSGSSSRIGAAWSKARSRETSPTNRPTVKAGGAGDAAAAAAVAAAGGDGAVAAISNAKMLKIGANVRFRGDVMECNTVVLCGRLQVGGRERGRKGHARLSFIFPTP